MIAPPSLSAKIAEQDAIIGRLHPEPAAEEHGDDGGGADHEREKLARRHSAEASPVAERRGVADGCAFDGFHGSRLLLMGRADYVEASPGAWVDKAGFSLSFPAPARTTRGLSCEASAGHPEALPARKRKEHGPDLDG